MKLIVGAVAAALVLSTGAVFKIEAKAADDAVLAACPPNTTTITRECADAVCASVANATNLDVAEQALVGRDAAVLIRDYGASDAANATVIQDCVATGPSGVFAAYNGSEVAQVGESVPASEQ